MHGVERLLQKVIIDTQKYPKQNQIYTSQRMLYIERQIMGYTLSG